MRLPRRVKDWPKDAKAAFKYTKDQLWKWAKDKPGRDRTGLALIAYVGTKEAFEGTTVHAKVYDDVIVCNTEEEVWDKILQLASRN